MRAHIPRARPMDFTDADERFRSRFWSKVNVTDPDDCWEWTAGRKPHGYGQFYIRKGAPRTASRVAFALSVPIPEGVQVCHRCDNPPCCNPAHLFLGTAVENVNDCIAKGRGNRAAGERHRSAKLTPEQVRQIRATPNRYGALSALARELGVSPTTVHNAANGITWKDVA